MSIVYKPINQRYYMHPKNYTLEDLILDSAFNKWVKNPIAEDGALWLEWASLSEENKNLIEEAREIIFELSKDDDAPVQQELADLWLRISKTNEAFDRKGKSKKRLLGISPSWQSIAAAVTAFLFLSVLAFLVLNRDIRYKTAYGENKEITLPDGSVVFLNANSSVSYAPGWNSDRPREVWLDGEAFFSVSHKSNSQKFLVHTDEVDVQVLGTKFNVNTRRGKTRVILNSGKVKLYLVKQHNKEVNMKPGELVDVSAKKELVLKRPVKAANYSAWVNKKLVFEETTLKEIAALLKENYGFNVKFSSPELEQLTFTGTIDSGNTELLFTILQKTFNISIIKKEEEITIAKKGTTELVPIN